MVGDVGKLAYNMERQVVIMWYATEGEAVQSTVPAMSTRKTWFVLLGYRIASLRCQFLIRIKGARVVGLYERHRASNHSSVRPEYWSRLKAI
jgi:hypothetical protein